MTTDGSQQSNPFSTGGGGVNFETRIQAAFTLLLLTGRPAPALPPYPLYQLKLQGRYAGFHVDDFIAYARDPVTGREAKLLAQIKHQVSVTQGDAVFGEVIDAAWRDFSGPEFDPETDALALITGPLTLTDTRDVRPLLEWARHCADEGEFFDKVATGQFSSEGKRRKLEVFRFHLGRASGAAGITDAQFWGFLKHFHLIGYDLDAEEGSTLALLLTLIGQTSVDAPGLLWARLVDAVQTANQNAGTITTGTLPADLCAAFSPQTGWTRDLERLEQHGSYVLGGIRSDVGGVHVERGDTLAQLQHLVQESSFVWVTGPRGSGKSSLVQAMAQRAAPNARVFCLRAEDLNHSSLTQVFTALGLQGSPRTLEASLALIPNKYLFIESLEKVLELGNTGGFRDLLQFLKNAPGWTVVASGRHYAYQQIAFEFLQPSQVTPAVLELSGFDEAQVDALCEALEPLGLLRDNPTLKALLASPFMADLAYRAVSAGARFTPQDGEREFRHAVWREVIAKESERSQGMPARRRATFIQIAVERARQMVYGIPDDDFDAEVVSKLEEDHLILRAARTRRLSPAHDVLEDWALEEFIDALFQRHGHDVPVLLQAIGHEPAMGRAFRLWLRRELQGGHDVADLILRVIREPAAGRRWQDEAITAVLLSSDPAAFLRQLGPQLFAHGGELLRRFCFVLRVGCMTPRFDLVLPPSSGAPEAPPLWLRPYGSGWGALIGFTLEHCALITGDLRVHLTAVLEDWTSDLYADIAPSPTARAVGLLALHLIEPIKDQYRDSDVRTSLLEILIKVAGSVSEEFTALVEQDVVNAGTRHRRRGHVRDLLKKIFFLPGTAFLSISHPELLMRVAWDEWVQGVVQDEDDDHWHHRSRVNIEQDFGLQSTRRDFFPASGNKGPFAFLLNRRGLQGLDFILRLCNHAAQHYAHSGLEQGRGDWSSDADRVVQPIGQTELRLNDGSVVQHYVSERLWLGFRGSSVLPGLLQCALMALENWLIALAEQDGPSGSIAVLESVYNRILRGSNSVLTTAVLASVATGFSEKLGHAALPILRVFPFHELDLRRMNHEGSLAGINLFAGIGTVFKAVYVEERSVSNRRPWRQRRLEHLLIDLQFSSYGEEAMAVVDELHATSTGSPSERFLLHRVDSRRWQSKLDEERGQITFRTEVEPDLADLQRENQQDQEVFAKLAHLFFWAEAHFKGKTPEAGPYPSWHEALNEARCLSEDRSNTPLQQMYEGTPATVAAVCLREHLDEMTTEEAEWCADITVATAVQGADTLALWDVRPGSPDGTSVAASVLPLVLALAQSGAERQIVQEMILLALTHQDPATRMAAADGVRLHLWTRDAVFAERCLTGTLAYARFDHDRLRRRGYQHALTEDEQLQVATAEQQAKTSFRQRWLMGEFDTEAAAISFQNSSIDFVLLAALMVPDGSIQTHHVEVLEGLIRHLFSLEEQGADHQNHGEIAELPHMQEDRLMKRLATSLLTLAASGFEPFTAVLLEGCERAPSFMDSLLLRVAVETEETGTKERYWTFWETLAPKLLDLAARPAAEESTDWRESSPRQLLKNFVFSGVPWQPVDYANQNIRLGKTPLLNFFRQAGTNRDVLDGLAALMYHFPSIFFEEGLIILADWRTGPGRSPLTRNTAFHIERAVQRYLQVDHPGPIPRPMYGACLAVLDEVVETASARAYYLREQLVHSRRIA